MSIIGNRQSETKKNPQYIGGNPIWRREQFHPQLLVSTVTDDPDIVTTRWPHVNIPATTSVSENDTNGATKLLVKITKRRQHNKERTLKRATQTEKEKIDEQQMEIAQAVFSNTGAHGAERV
ncbi:hypothetical protein scyTo_0001451 [Scyliorhinus torazame]|uniref:Uncharacterized protein n=1 Tax=Scyliorhinus torazame TaxID=75743 RepID=A0A401PD83_SCYTO|nr:hypothetical protein [Scyliorhinus torazame]